MTYKNRRIQKQMQMSIMSEKNQYIANMLFPLISGPEEGTRPVTNQDRDQVPVKDNKDLALRVWRLNWNIRW